jgi:hypothetical protein
MEQCAHHVDYQLPNQHGRVGYLLLAGIENNDPGLQATMATVRTDKASGGMRNNSKECIAHIVPYCPLAKKRTTGTKGGAAEILEVHADSEDAEVASFGTKSAKGSRTDTQSTTVEEKNKLWEWQEAQRSGILWEKYQR